MIKVHVLVGLVALFVACTRDNPQTTTTGAQADKTSFTVKGSDTMVILGQRWSETYMKEHAGITIQVTGGGSGTGIAALINGTTDICESSRPMETKEKDDLKAKQKGAVAIETKVALDALAVYVNEKNTIKEIAIPEGRHRIEIRNGTLPAYASDVNVAAGGRVSIAHSFDSQ